MVDELTYVHADGLERALQLVTFEPDGPLSLYLARERGRDPVALCDGPCAIALEVGEHRFSVARGDEDPQRAARPLVVSTTADAAVRLRVRYEDRGDLRAIGWTTLVGGVLGGIALAITGSMMGNSTESATFELAPVLLVSGVTVMIASAITGSYLAGLRDLGHVEF